MKWTTVIFSLVLMFCLLVSCAPTGIYYWGNYSDTLYKVKKQATPESYEKHKREIQQIIEQSQYNGKKVPPGIYAEYGFIMLKEKKYDDCMKYLNLEFNCYPESQNFISVLKKQVEKERSILNEKNIQ